MTTYRITYLLGEINTSTCPPAIVSVIFPNFNGEATTMDESQITVTFDTEQSPIDLGPLVKVQKLSN
jgi:hypothetical protein